jgi:hypothetical protein
MPVTSRQIVSNLLGLAGAVVGGALGYYLFLWIVDQGFYGLMIPGALLGLGCGLLSRHVSTVRGALCAVAAIFLGMFAEWHFRWFTADESFGYLITHFYQKRYLTQIMLVLGAVFAFWLGKDAGFGRLSGGTGRMSPAPRDGSTASR